MGSQAQKVFKFYAEKINALPADIQTAAQKAILEKPETKAILEGKKEIEESKDEAKATCIIELLGVRNIEKAENDEESKETEEDNQSKVACCVDFSYRDKTAKKTSFRISKHGKPSSTHGSTCPARRSDYKLSNAVFSITALNLYGG